MGMAGESRPDGSRPDAGGLEESKLDGNRAGMVGGIAVQTLAA